MCDTDKATESSCSVKEARMPAVYKSELQRFLIIKNEVSTMLMPKPITYFSHEQTDHLH